MLRLSKKADYALMAMKHLATARRTRRRRARARLPSEYDIPVELLAKVLQRLARRGLLALASGHARRLHARRRPPPSISVADIIQAIDGPLTVTACSTDDGAVRAVRERCNVRDPLWRIKDRIIIGAGHLSRSPRSRRKSPARPTSWHRSRSAGSRTAEPVARSQPARQLSEKRVRAM